MRLLITILGLAVAAWLSQLWDERRRRTAATTATDLIDTARCQAERAKQLAYVPRHEDDHRTAGRAIAPRAETRRRAPDRRTAA